LSSDSLTFSIIGLVVTHPYNITQQLFKSEKNQARENPTKKMHLQHHKHSCILDFLKGS